MSGVKSSAKEELTSSSSPPRREKKRSREFRDEKKSPPFNAFSASSRIPKVRVVHRNSSVQLLEVRNRDKWLNIEQASRLANSNHKKQDNNKMKEFKDKHGRGSSWNADKGVACSEVKRVSVPVWRPSKQSEGYVQRGMLKPGVVKCPISKESFARKSAVSVNTIPGKICCVNLLDDNVGEKTKSSVPKAREGIEESDVIMLNNDDQPVKESNKESGIAFVPSVKGTSGEAKDAEKYHVPGALGWYVHVPETRYNNQLIPVLPRFK